MLDGPSLEIFSQVVRSILCGTFLLSGMVEISPGLSEEVHFLSLFEDFSRVVPLLNFISSQEVYRILIGTTELTCSVLILCSSGTSEVVLLSYYILLSIMLGSVYSHFRIGDSFLWVFLPLLYAVMLLFMIKRSR